MEPNLSHLFHFLCDEADVHEESWSLPLTTWKLSKNTSCCSQIRPERITWFFCAEQNKNIQMFADTLFCIWQIFSRRSDRDPHIGFGKLQVETSKKLGRIFSSSKSRGWIWWPSALSAESPVILHTFCLFPFHPLSWKGSKHSWPGINLYTCHDHFSRGNVHFHNHPHNISPKK